MESLVSKALRLRKPRYVNIQLRAEVYDAILRCASEYEETVSVFIRGIVEDFYDQYLVDQEVTRDEQA